MTENQLKYLAYQESMRHNAAMEANDAKRIEEQERANRANEELKEMGILTDATLGADKVDIDQQNTRLKTADVLSKMINPLYGLFA